MEQFPGPFFDMKLCSRCGLCARVCPKDIIVIEDEITIVTERNCILCTHCYSVCPAGAVSFNLPLRNTLFKTITPGEDPVNGPVTPGALAGMMQSRRSIRLYSDKTVSPDIISDLLECAVTAPSGSNCQLWEFTILNGREKVFQLAERIGDFFKKINRIAGNPLFRFLSVIISGKKLIRYYKNNYSSVSYGLKEAEKGRDLLFHGAQALIIISSPMEGSLPLEDAQYAAYNIALLAHSMGLGTCFIGYASEVMNRVRSVKTSVGIPSGNRVHAVLTLGYPEITFRRHALRKEYRCRYV